MRLRDSLVALGQATWRPRVGQRLTGHASTVRVNWKSTRILLRAGVVQPPDTWRQAVGILRASGIAGIASIFALRSPGKPAIIDSEGPLSYAEFAASVVGWTNALHTLLPSERQPTVGIICRNSRFLLIALLGAVGVGARVVFLNTDLGPRQLATVCEREGIELVIFDAEFGPAIREIGPAITRVIAHDVGVVTENAGDQRMTTLMSAAQARSPARPQHRPDMIILTSGSTGTPKGIARGSGGPMSLATAAGLLDRIPMRGDDRIFLAPPAFHGWGLITSMLALMMGATLVFDRRFDANRCSQLVEEHGCTALIAVPTMLQRLTSAVPDLVAPMAPTLRFVASGGGRLSPEVVIDIQKRLGPVLYNLYGSTEASYISIATPGDLAADPTCAGTPALGVDVAILRDGIPVPAGESGEIFVSTAAQVSEYTDGRTKETLGGLLRTGDVGRFDAAGRLLVEGRADGMIVSGGENVFPEVVELTLLRHRDVTDAKVVTVEDSEFGHVLVAFVVVSGDRTDVDALRQHVAAELSRSWVPRKFVFVAEIPRTSTGKVTHATVQSLMADEKEEAKK